MKSNPLIGPVTIPRRAHSGMAVLPWAQDVNRAIQQLRDRRAMAGGASGRSPAGSDFNFILVETTLSIAGDPAVIQYNDLSGPFYWCIRSGIIYRPEDLDEDDRDDNGGEPINPDVAGEKYDRYVFRVLSPEVASFLPFEPVSPPAAMDMQDPNNSIVQPLL